MDKSDDSTALDSSAANGNADDSTQDGHDGGTLEQQLQKERSNRGREVATLKSELAAMRQSLESMQSGLSRSVPSDVDEPPVKYITTPEELEIYNEWKATKEEKRRRLYAIDYVKSAKGLSYINPDLHADIEKELLASDTKFGSFTNFSDAAKDAEINYRIAETNVLKRKLSEVSGKGPFKGKGNLATGVTVTSDDVEGKGVVVELDEYARKFMSALGEKEDADWVQKSVKRQDIS